MAKYTGNYGSYKTRYKINYNKIYRGKERSETTESERQNSREYKGRENVEKHWHGNSNK